MSKIYKLSKQDSVGEILDPDGDIILTGKTADMGLLVMLLNNRTSDKYKVAYHYNSDKKIDSSSIFVGEDFIVELPEGKVSDETQTCGYGILTHLNRKH